MIKSLSSESLRSHSHLEAWKLLKYMYLSSYFGPKDLQRRFDFDFKSWWKSNRCYFSPFGFLLLVSSSASTPTLSSSTLQRPSSECSSPWLASLCVSLAPLATLGPGMWHTDRKSQPKAQIPSSDSSTGAGTDQSAAGARSKMEIKIQSAAC